jgi:hypothetical protein
VKLHALLIGLPFVVACGSPAPHPPLHASGSSAPAPSAAAPSAAALIDGSAVACAPSGRCIAALQVRGAGGGQALSYQVLEVGKVAQTVEVCDGDTAACADDDARAAAVARAARELDPVVARDRYVALERRPAQGGAVTTPDGVVALDGARLVLRDRGAVLATLDPAFDYELEAAWVGGAPTPGIVVTLARSPREGRIGDAELTMLVARR